MSNTYSERNERSSTLLQPARGILRTPSDQRDFWNVNRWDRTEPRVTIQEDATDFNLNGHAQSDRDMYNRGSYLDGDEQFGLFDESDRQSDRVFLNRTVGRQRDATELKFL